MKVPENRHALDLHADGFVQSLSEDELHRAPFAEQLGLTMREWPGKESLVIELSGPWGSGKTSIWKMAREAMVDPGNRTGLQREEIARRIIEFNPWEIAGEKALTADFFARIGEAVDDVFRGSPSVVHVFRKYAAQVSRALGFVVGAAGIADAAKVPLAGLFGALCERAKALLTRAGHGRIREELKDTLRKELEKMPHPFVVVIDDIDRLTAAEIVMLFRLIKANLDLPRFVFLLLYDRNYVERALNRVTVNRGSEFLEKIVQVSLQIPAAREEQLQIASLNELTKIGDELPPGRGNWNENRARQIVFEVIKFRSSTLREIKRWANQTRFLATALAVQPEVAFDLVDLALLEWIRLRWPRLYAQLPEKGNELTAGNLIPTSAMRAMNRGRETPAALNKLLEPVPPEERDDAHDLLEFLFGDNAGWHDLRDHVTGGVWASQWFMPYFAFADSSLQLSNREIREMRKALDDEIELGRWLTAALQNARLIALLTHLTLHASEDYLSLLPVLAAVCDNLAPVHAGALENAHLALLRGCADLARREKVLAECIQSTKVSEYLLAFRRVGLIAGKDADYGSELFDADATERLRNLIGIRFTSLLESEARGRPSFFPKLGLWCAIAGSAGVESWLKAQLSTVDSTSRLLWHLACSRSSVDEILDWESGFRRLGDFVPLSTIKTGVERITSLDPISLQRLGHQTTESARQMQAALEEAVQKGPATGRI